MVNPRYKEDCLECLVPSAKIAGKDSIVALVIFDWCVYGISPADHHFTLPVEERWILWWSNPSALVFMLISGGMWHVCGEGHFV